MKVYILESRVLSTGEYPPSPWVIDSICDTLMLAMEHAELGRENYLDPLKFAPMPDFGDNMRLQASDGFEEWRIREFGVETE